MEPKILSPAAFTLRPLTHADVDWLLALRNRDEVRAASRDPTPIPRRDHLRWLARVLEPDAPPCAWVATLDGQPVGYVRLAWAPVPPQVSWALVPEVRGRGLGTALLRLAVEGPLARRPLAAIIRDDNRPSRRSAEAVGFTLEDTLHGWCHYVRYP